MTSPVRWILPRVMAAYTSPRTRAARRAFAELRRRSEARERLDRDDGWRGELEANREALFALGLWGVPSYCLRDPSGAALFSTWGQDRLWLVEAQIRRRLAA